MKKLHLCQSTGLFLLGVQCRSRDVAWLAPLYMRPAHVCVPHDLHKVIFFCVADGSHFVRYDDHTVDDVGRIGDELVVFSMSLKYTSLAMLLR